MEKYYATFGCGQPLANCYVEIIASNYENARKIMIVQFGECFSFMYSENEKEDSIDPYNYKLLVTLEQDKCTGINFIT